MSNRTYQKGAVGKPRTRLFLLGVSAAGLLAAVISAYIGYNAAQTVPGRSYYNLKAEFVHAENLANHYEVRVGGLRAGQMLRPRVHNGKALIDLRLSSAFKPLLSDTTVRIRLRSAVGVRYVEIVPGTKGSPLQDGATIPSSQTARPVALDQVLGTFDPTTRVRTQELLRQLGGGAAGRGEQVNRAVQLAPRFLSGLSGVSGAITARTGSMGRFIRSTEAAAETFSPVRGAIARGFEPEARAARAFGDRAGSIRSTLQEAPSALAQLRSGLPSVTRLVAQVDGLAREGRPALAAAPGALHETSRLLINARPSLDRADRTLELARRAVDPSLHLLSTLRPVLPGLDSAFGSLVPNLKSVGDHACDISNAFTGWAYSMAWGDDFASGIRFFVSTHADQVAGVTGKVPDPLGRDRLVHTSPYPAPCVGNVGAEAGPERPTLEAYLRSLGYTGGKP
jgi:ABC-type transporter Mla subunit MlaD